MTAHPRHLLKTYLEEIAGDLNLSIDDVRLNSAEPKFGQFATSLALVAAKEAKKSPLSLADDITQRLASKKEIASAQAVAPGFVNISLTQEFWLQWLNTGLLAGLAPKKKTGKKINLEFVSANPTGPLVLVNAWQAFYGDVLGKIMSWHGEAVSLEYYSNDTGNQIMQLGRAIQVAAGANTTTEEKTELYRGDYINKLAERLSHDYGGQDQLAGADSYSLGQAAASILFDQIKQTIHRLGFSYDRFFSEAEVDLDDALAQLKSHNAVYEKDGATWLKKEMTGAEQDRVLIRSNGKGPTYFFKDIAYQINRLAVRKFDIAITITGPDHHAESLYLAQTLKHLGYDGFVPLSTQTVRIVKDGRQIKMSKRAGEYIALDDFLDQVPVDVARFYFASRDLSSHIDIDLDSLVEKSKSNPVYYTMYAYVRAKSILAAAKQKGFAPHSVNHDLSSYEMLLVQKLAELETTMEDITTHYKISSLLLVLSEAARSFHSYYEHDRILTLTDDNRLASKLGFIKLFCEVFEIVYQVIGITPSEKM